MEARVLDGAFPVSEGDASVLEGVFSVCDGDPPVCDALATAVAEAEAAFACEPAADAPPDTSALA